MPRQFSEDETREILALAAERSHAARSDTAPRLTLDELEEAARAAGIDPTHVRSAAADVLSPGRRAVHRTFLGVPVEVRRTRTLPRPLEPDEWAETVERLRDEFGKRGVVTDLGRTHEWASHPDDRQAPVRVVAEPAPGGTRVTAERTTWNQALGVTLGAGTNLAVALVLATVWLASGADSMLWVPALLLAVVAAAFGTVGLSRLRDKGHRQADAFERVLGALADSTATPEPAVAPVQAEPLGGLGLDPIEESPAVSESDGAARAPRTRA